MATSAFKSTSRRGSAAGTKATPPPPAAASRRRSHSVSAVSRKIHLPFDDNTLTSTEFSNSRDNPLFWTASSSPPDREECREAVEVAYSNNKERNSLNASAKSSSGSSSNYVIEQRGRSTMRSSSNTGLQKNGIGRSLSRTRGRSVSRASFRGGVYENGKVQDMVISGARSRDEVKRIGNGLKTSNSVRTMFDTRGHPEKKVLKTVQNQAIEWSENDSACSLSNLDDDFSTGSLTEAEEKTIKAVCEKLKTMGEDRGDGIVHSGIYETVRSEVRRAIPDIQGDLESTIHAFQRNNASTITATNFDVPPYLENPGAIEFISDIRREYATKRGESEERARKLRTDLAIEQQHGQELDRVLNEILSEPRTTRSQKSRRGRRTSNERKRVANRLTEEAMSYFDECVSLSTFDSSDFSAPEDPISSSAGVNTSTGGSSLVEGSPSTLRSYDDQHSGSLQQTQVQLLNRFENSGMTNKVSCAAAQLYEFSFANQQSQSCASREDLKSYIKHFEKVTKNDVESDSYYDADNYLINSRVETLLVDRVLYNNRIHSGGLLLCGGALSFPHFASIL